MTCDWHDDCCGEGEFEYEGWILALPDGGSWSIQPYRGGRGGRRVVVGRDGVIPATGAEIDRWTALDTSAFAARVTIESDRHPPERPERWDPLIESDTPAPALPVTRIRHRQGRLIGRCDQQQIQMDAAWATNDDRNRLQHCPVWAWRDADDHQEWQFDDADGFLRERAVAAQHHATDHWREERKAALGALGGAFVNPYSFVPLGAGPIRREPVGHRALPESRVSGRIVVEGTAISPLALSGAGCGDQTNPNRPVFVDNAWMLPGSSLAGAARAFHEALTDACLRVVDDDYVPVHRDFTAPQRAGAWRMAVVEPGGTSVRLCDPVHHMGKDYSSIWVEARHVAGVGGLTSNMRFHVNPATIVFEVKHHRLERDAGSTPTLCAIAGCGAPHWRTIVTAALPGRTVAPTGNEHPYHLPFALETACVVPLPAGVVDDYAKSARDAEDVVRRRRGAAPHLAVAGVGTRQETTEQLMGGDVVWVEMHGGHVVRVSRSVLWRIPGKVSVGDRIGRYRPCSSPDSLCPSCALFGMIEERDSHDDALEEGTLGAARVDAYRGHVRFQHASIDTVEDAATHLREMGSPRPSAGQFYLDNSKASGQQAAKEQRPLREWGSQADVPHARTIRGRKFYWASSKTPDRRYVAQEGNDQMTSHHRLSPSGTKLEWVVTFDNVSHAQLGALLVSLVPNLLRDPRARETLAATTASEPAIAEALGHDLGLHLGKGKGLGLGTIVTRLHEWSPSGSHPVAEAESHHVADAGAGEDAVRERPDWIEVWGPERYSTPAAASQRRDPMDYVLAFLAEADTSRWGPLLAMSAVDWVPPESILYPPDDDPTGDFTFDFWRRSTGASGTVQIHPSKRVAPTLVALPSADAADPRVPRPWLEEMAE